MATNTPLLLLLDGLLSQDEARVEFAVHEIVPLLPKPFVVPLGVSIVRNLHLLYEVLSLLLSAQPDLCQVASTHDDSLPLHFASSLGDVQVVSLIHKAYPAAAFQENRKGKIPLMYAAREGHVDVVRFFLQAQPSTASIASHKHKLALHFAAGDGHVAVVQELLKTFPQGASMPSAKGKIPIHFAARWNHLQVAQDLLKVYPDGVRALDWEGNLPLHEAAREGQLAMSKYLVELFPTALTIANLRGEVPLFPAARSSNMGLVILFLQAWPGAGQLVLKSVSEVDHIEDWNWDIIALLLRGAVDNFCGCQQLRGHDPPAVKLMNHWQSVRPSGSPSDKKRYKKLSASEISQMRPELVEEQEHFSPEPCSLLGLLSQGRLECFCCSARQPTHSHAQTTPPRKTAFIAGRSKSPILEKAEGSDKLSRKRKRPLWHMAASSSCYGTGVPDTCPRVFLPLNAAFQCGASPRVTMHVLSTVAANQPEDLTKKDGFGYTPLHWAVTNVTEDFLEPIFASSTESSSSDSSTSGRARASSETSLLQLIKEHLVTPTAAQVFDNEQQLPLHLALQSRAHPALIEELLNVYPSAGVQPCRLAACEDGFYSPVHVACHNDCDLNTVYRLLRIDPSVLQGNK